MNQLESTKHQAEDLNKKVETNNSKKSNSIRNLTKHWFSSDNAQPHVSKQVMEIQKTDSAKNYNNSKFEVEQSSNKPTVMDLVKGNRNDQSKSSTEENNFKDLYLDKKLVTTREGFLQRLERQTTKAGQEVALGDLRNLYHCEKIAAQRMLILKSAESQNPEQDKLNRDTFLKSLDYLENKYRKAGVVKYPSFAKYQETFLRQGINITRRYFP